MNGSSLKLEQPCPQCGGAVELDETDRILTCSFCRVRLFMHHNQYPRYYWPPSRRVDTKRLVYVPYWRFRGMRLAVAGRGVNARVVDTTLAALKNEAFPTSTGIRAQALRLRFVHEGVEGAFLPYDLNRKHFQDNLTKSYAEVRRAEKGTLYHQAFVGEVVSLVYTPYLCHKEHIEDGVTGRILDKRLGPEFRMTARQTKHESTEVQFWSTLCPRCGWDLEGDKDSLVLVCCHCDRIWEAARKGFRAITAHLMFSRESADVWIPFWAVKVSATGLDLESYADFLRLTNQARAPRAYHESQPFYFWSPACKLNPRLFVHLGGWMTMKQRPLEKLESIPKGGFYPVTLPPVEGFQGTISILGQVTSAKRKLFPKLKNVRFGFRSYRLVLVPFRLRGSEYLQDELGISIPANALKWGRAI